MQWKNNIFDQSIQSYSIIMLLFSFVFFDQTVYPFSDDLLGMGENIQEMNLDNIGFNPATVPPNQG